MSNRVIADPPAIEGLEFIRHLGSGGYSDVFLYAQVRPRRNVAVKVLKGAGITDQSRRQFTAEADAMAELADHPNIVSVFAADVTADGRPYLVMSFYPKDNLGLRCATERLAVSEVLRIGVQIASAVETAHRAGILHRDIKPANILTNQYGTVGLTDFGIAAQTAAASEDDDTGVSVPWSPAEILFATAAASPQSDVYSLGATLWHLLVGRSPFEVPSPGDNSAFALMQRIRDLPAPATGRPDVPGALERLLGQSLAKQADVRPPTALNFARSLQSIEQELRLTRTEIVVIEDDAHFRRAEMGSEDPDATNRRVPTRVDAQTPTPPAPTLDLTGPATFDLAGEEAVEAAGPIVGLPELAEPTRRRPPTISVGLPDTMLPAAARPQEPEPKPQKDEGRDGDLIGSRSERRGRRDRSRRGLLLAAGAVVLVASVGAVALVGMRGPSEAGRVPTSTSPDTGTLVPDRIPGDPVLASKAVQDPATGRGFFVWSYPDPQRGDRVGWRLQGGPETIVEPRADGTFVAIVDHPPGAFCIYARVATADHRPNPNGWIRMCIGDQ